jgi:hypothetical protein
MDDRDFGIPGHYQISAHFAHSKILRSNGEGMSWYFLTTVPAAIRSREQMTIPDWF